MKQSEILELLDAQEIDPKGTRNFRDIPYCWERVRELVLNSLWHDAVKDPPKENKNYLGWLWGSIHVVARREGRWLLNQPVEYWMPLPLPPERSGE